MKVTLLKRGSIESNMNKFKTGLVAMLAIMFTIVGVTAVHAYTIEEKEMCYGYSETTLAPLGETEAFLTTQEEAGVWLKISNPPDKVTFKFYYTENNIEKEYTGGYSRVDVIEKEGTNWGIAFSTMDISGKTPEFNPGYWTCKAYIDGEPAAILNFNVVDYDNISEQVASIVESFNTLKEEKEQLEEANAGFEAIFEEQEERFDEQEAQLEDLEDSTVSQTELYDLTRQYDDLLRDYSSTRMMMYASIVVALVAVIVAVYFGVMKK
jgi:hypothetical protein